jgi:formate dehydrogenase subunit gamma
MDDRRSSVRDAERDEATLRAMLAASSTAQSALLPLLHQVQQEFGHISRDAIPLIASAFNLSRAEVHGVVTFYHDFHEEPTAATVVQLCMAEACQSVGCRKLAEHAQQRLGIGWHGRTDDGRLQLEPAYCFGNCAAGPAMRIGDRIHGRVTTERFDAVLDALDGGGAR